MAVRKLIPGILFLALLTGVFVCSKNGEAAIVNTFEQTPLERVEETEDAVLKTYYEMSDGTWKADNHVYEYKLVITGRLNHAIKDITYTILSNVKDITFEQAWKASGLSSNSNDYFEIEDAVFVAIS